MATKAFDPEDQSRSNEDILDQLLKQPSMGSPFPYVYKPPTGEAGPVPTAAAVKDPSAERMHQLELDSTTGKPALRPRGRTTPAPPPRTAAPSTPPATHYDPEQDLETNPPQMMGAGDQTEPAANEQPGAMERATPDEVSNRPPLSNVPPPTPFGPTPPDVQSLMKQQQDKNAKLMLMAGLARGGDTINHALTRQPIGESPSAEMFQGQITDPLEKAHKVVALDQLMRASQIAQAHADPNSAYNTNLRNATARMFKAPELAESGLTADALEKVLPSFANRQTAQTRNEMEGKLLDLKKDIEAHKLTQDEIKNELAKMGIDLRGQIATAMLGMANARLQQGENHFQANKAEAYGKAQSEFAPFYSGYQRIQETIDKLGRLPGTGPIEGRIHAWFLSPEGQRFRLEVSNMAINYDKQIGGVRAVNPAMADRMQEATGLIKTGTDQQILAGLHMLKDATDAHLNAIRAGFDPSVVSTVDARGGMTPGSMPAAPAAEPTVKLKSKRTGTVRDLPASKAQRYLTEQPNDYERVQ